MKLTAIDKNFVLQNVTDPNVVWYDITTPPFSLHGILNHETDGLVRMPIAVAERLSQGRVILSKHLAGGRIRFRTNSSYVAVKCNYRFWDVMQHMPISGSHGFAVYKNGEYRSFTAPTAKQIAAGEQSDNTPFDGTVNLYCDGKVVDVELCLPLYSGVWGMQIGLEGGCVLEAHAPYKHQKPVLFYGSSITQGACASHPGNDYVNTLSRWLDTDIWNLGFSGGAKGEKAIAEHIAAQDASVFVLDYDWNAPTPEHLKETHYPLYQTIRSTHPTTPIVFSSKPDFFGRADDITRRSVILESYQRAVEGGDKNVYFIDGETLFGTHERAACTVDNVHPNDLGFFRMAQAMYPTLKKLLEK